MSEKEPPKVYQAHVFTGEYIGQSYADPDPMVPGNWLIPGMAFTEAPPIAEKGFAAVHIPGGKEIWSLLPDLRGTVYQTDTGQPVQWEKFGELPEGLTSMPRPGPYHFWKEGEWKLDAAVQTEGQKVQAFAKRDQLLGEAAIRISPLQDAVDLGDATTAEEAELKKWKQYRVAVNRVDQQPGFPRAVSWPPAPEPTP
ncbi:tail fiber assembly protein [Pseudomonas piscis]|uniref:tail fiber assembly protein n=1 Tax=Pseudomonas piscis TaxID=2614538 RepID=UPI0021D59595|nr:tail fiber assembly protein [Pseudomonas piscis]MCU7647119.1 tail fiber assembly protein [Pseudomonas piscis]